MFSWLKRTLLVDLGSYSTLIADPAAGVIFNEPTIVLCRRKQGKLLPIAYGLEAKQAVGKTPDGVSVEYPVRKGVITNFLLAEWFIKSIFSHLIGNLLFPIANRIFVAVPMFLSDVEKKTFLDLLKPYAREVKLLPSSLVCAIGADLPVGSTRANLIVDIGGGKTEIAILSLRDTVFMSSLQVGGSSFDDAIINFLRREFLFQIGEQSAEILKISALSVDPEHPDVVTVVKGINLEVILPGTLTVSSRDLRLAVSDPLNVLRQAILMILENSPPEVAVDIASSGMTLVGGGASLRGLVSCLAKDLGVKVHTLDNPHLATVHGLAKIVSEEAFSFLLAPNHVS